MRRIVVALLAAAVLVGSAVVGVSFFNQDRGTLDIPTTRPASESTDLVETACDLACVELRAIEIAQEAGGAAAAEYVDSIDDPTIRYGCHAVYHAIGRVVGEAGWPTYMTDTCQYGYLHGVLQARAMYSVDADLVAGLATFCGRFEGALATECQHGLGHAVAISVSTDLGAALRTCASVGPALADTCSGGVMMEYAEDYAEEWLDWSAEDEFLGTGERLTSVAEDTDFGALCPSLPASVQRQCYSMIWVFVYPMYQEDVGRASGICPDALDASLHEACHAGIARYVLALMERDDGISWPPESNESARAAAKTVNHLCGETSDSKICLEYAARSLYLEAFLLETSKDLTIPLCEEANLEQRTACEKGRNAAQEQATLLRN